MTSGPPAQRGKGSGLRKAMPIHVGASLLPFPRACINGGRRGHLIGIAPQVLGDLLGTKPVRCALAG